MVFIPWNYLRVRGEYLVAPLGGGQNMELPPRARRIHRLAKWLNIPMGTTSACAENTIILVFPHLKRGNYLRVRGEYVKGGKQEWLLRELPPRARRILQLTFKVDDLEGTTSACAENTLSP